MKLEFKDIIDAHKGKVGLVIATGPSSKPYVDVFEKITKENKDEYCSISINQYDTMSNIQADYRVVANSVFTVKAELERFNKATSTLLYADSVDTTDRKFVEENLKTPYLGFDQRHFNSKSCDNVRACCGNIVPGRLTIQEELQKYTGYEKKYTAIAATAAIHMLAFSVLIGCKTIYITGVDLDYTKGYMVDNHKNGDTFKPWLSSIYTDLEIIKKSAEKIGVEIFSSSEGSPINSLFTYKEFKHGVD